MTIRKSWAVAALVTVVALAGAVQGAVAASAPDSKRLGRAKDYIADEQWQHAIDELKAAVADPKEPNKDEALFWLAHSEHQVQDLAAAVDTIAHLEHDFPTSRWVRPARSLRVEIAQQLRRNDVLWYAATPPPPPPPAVPPNPPAVAPPAPAPPQPRMPTPPRAPEVRTPPTPRPAAVAAPLPPEAPGVFEFPVPPNPEAWFPAPFAPDTDLRIQALGSLLHTNPDRVIPLLREIALESKDAGEARRAVFVLAQSGTPEARTTVVEVARSGSEPVRVAAVRELGRFGGADAGPELMEVYSTASPRVKTEVVSSLAVLGHTADTAALLRIAKTESDPQIRNIAILTLGRPGVKDLTPLRSLYATTPRASRRTVLVALANARDDDELIHIASTEKDLELRQEARRQLRLLGTPKALKYLGNS
jgi:HEAT repeat protein